MGFVASPESSSSASEQERANGRAGERRWAEGFSLLERMCSRVSKYGLVPSYISQLRRLSDDFSVLFASTWISHAPSGRKFYLLTGVIALGVLSLMFESVWPIVLRAKAGNWGDDYRFCCISLGFWGFDEYFGIGIRV